MATASPSAAQNATRPKLPADPPPRIADRASEAPGLEAQLIADKAYATLWDDKHQDDRNLVLTAVAELLITEEIASEQVLLPESLAKELERRKLMNIVLKVSATIPRTGALPRDFGERAKSYIAGLATEPRRGVWMPKKTGSLAVEFTALAYWLNPEDAGYLREFIASRRGAGIGWENSKKPVRPYLVRERVALERLSLLATLTPEERRRLNELKASPLGDEPPDEIDLGELLKEYGSNEVRADDKFKEHVVEFSGVAGAIERRRIGGITLAIGTGRAFERPQAHCFFNESQTERVKAVNKGDRVRVRGKVDGLLVNVIVKSCELVE